MNSTTSAIDGGNLHVRWMPVLGEVTASITSSPYRSSTIANCTAYPSGSAKSSFRYELKTRWAHLRIQFERSWSRRAGDVVVGSPGGFEPFPDPVKGIQYRSVSSSLSVAMLPSSIRGRAPVAPRRVPIDVGLAVRLAVSLETLELAFVLGGNRDRRSPIDGHIYLPSFSFFLTVRKEGRFFICRVTLV